MGTRKHTLTGLLIVLCASSSACSEDDPAVTYDPTSDATAPMVRFVSPLADALIEPGEVVFEVEVSDDGPVSAVEFVLNDTTLQALQSPPWTTTWHPEDDRPSTHQLKAIATDIAGNQGHAEVSFTLTCDGSDCPPSILISAPEWAMDQAIVTATAQDDIGLTSVAFLADGAAIGTRTASPYEVTWDTSNVAEGPHGLVALATDTTGQATQSSVTIGVDRTPPDVALEAPTDGMLVADTIDFRAEITDISPTQLRCGILGTSIAETVQEPFAGTLDTSTLTPEMYTVLCTATDAVELTRQITRNVIVDRPPEIQITSHEDDDTVRARTRIEVAASDDVELLRVEVYASDILVGETEDGGVWWSPAAGPETADLRAIAYDSQGQSAEDRVTVLLEIDPCDQDGDGAQGDGEGCQNTDCDDSDDQAYPGAPDLVGDEIDQSCDGIDGIDNDTDGHASVQSGGRDCADNDPEVYPCPWDPEGICADRQNDPRNCGECNHVCNVGLGCQGGECLCLDEDCIPGDPDDYSFNGVQGSFFYRISVVTDADRGEDLNDDDIPDNAFGPLVSVLAQLLGGNVNRELTLQIQSGVLALGAAWPNLGEGLPDQSDVSVDIFTLVDTDEDPDTQDAYLIDRDGFLPGYQTPRSRFRSGELIARQLVAGPAASFFLEISLGEIPLAITIDNALLRARLTQDQLGIAMSSASIGGILTLESLVDTVNDFLLSERCECIHLDSPLVDLRAGQGRETCVGTPRPNQCAEEGLAVCATLARSCELFMDLLSAEADLDTDNDGITDAFSVYLSLSGRGTVIEGLADE